MKIDGSFTVSAPRHRVWAAIRNPDTVGPCIPGCKSIEVISPTLYKAQVGVSVGPIKASFNLDVEVIDEKVPVEVTTRTRGEEGTRASTVSAESRLVLDEIGEAETLVRYESDVSVVGRLGKFGLGIMKKKAASLGAEFADNVRTLIESNELAESSKTPETST